MGNSTLKPLHQFPDLLQAPRDVNHQKTFYYQQEQNIRQDQDKARQNNLLRQALYPSLQEEHKMLHYKILEKFQTL